MHCGPLKLADVVRYQLPEFGDAFNQVYSVAIYLLRLINELTTISFVLGKCRSKTLVHLANCKEKVIYPTKCY